MSLTITTQRLIPVRRDGQIASTGSSSSSSGGGTSTDLTPYALLASPTFTGTVGGITAAMVGLGSVDNTSDANKPVSTAQATAIGLKANIASPTFTGTVGGITKTMVGLSAVNNTADSAKPVSTAQQTALNLKANLASPTFTGTVSGITKSMVGLSNVDNTADSAKSVSYASTAGVLNVVAGNESTISNGYAGGGEVYINYRGSSGSGITGYWFANGLSNGGLVPLSASNFVATSDIRLKTNIKPIGLAPVNTEYKQFELTSEAGQIRYGVIAQELQIEHPELVRVSSEGTLSVAYFDLLCLEIASLKAEVAKLKERT